MQLFALLYSVVGVVTLWWIIQDHRKHENTYVSDLLGMVLLGVMWPIFIPVTLFVHSADKIILRRKGK